MKRNYKSFKELTEMMVGNSPGSGGAFSADSDPTGPVAGTTPRLGRKKNIDYRRVPMNYRKWVKQIENNKY